MDLIKKASEVAEKANEGWDKLPVAAKPAIVGVSILTGLLTYKLVVAIGTVLILGQRTVHKLGIFQQILEEETGITNHADIDSKEATQTTFKDQK